MKKILSLMAVLVLLLGCAAAAAGPVPAETPRTTKLTARFATVEEGQELMRGRTLFHDQITRVRWISSCSGKAARWRNILSILRNR